MSKYPSSLDSIKTSNSTVIDPETLKHCKIARIDKKLLSEHLKKFRCVNYSMHDVGTLLHHPALYNIEFTVLKCIDSPEHREIILHSDQFIKNTNETPECFFIDSLRDPFDRNCIDSPHLVPKRPPQNGYQPTHGDLDTSNPPQNGSGVPNHKAVVTCPVCYGTGHVDAGFYLQTQGSSSAGGTEPCRSCSGKGYVVV